MDLLTSKWGHCSKRACQTQYRFVKHVWASFIFVAIAASRPSTKSLHLVFFKLKTSRDNYAIYSVIIKDPIVVLPIVYFNTGLLSTYELNYGGLVGGGLWVGVEYLTVLKWCCLIKTCVLTAPLSKIERLESLQLSTLTKQQISTCT